MTPQQEQDVLEMLQAFQNGKKISELSSFDGDAISALLAVYDTEADTSKKATLAQLLPYLEDMLSYGIQYDYRVSAPVTPRVGNGILHRTLPIQSRMKGCLLDDNGDVVKYLNADSWTGETRDGSQGQVMVEIPAHYRKHTDYGYKKETRISEYALPGYTLIPKMYVSAYEASLQRTSGKLASVVNTSTDYRGGSNESSWDGTYRTLLGRPATSISRTDFRGYARNRKSGSTEWNCYVYEVHKNIFWLFTIEYATRNCQADYHADLSGDGFHQGGLGAGVTTLSSSTWSSYNSYNPFVPCGHTDSLGNGTGIVDYEMKDGSNNTVATVSVPRYRGIENPFGHIWKWTDGINIQITPTSGDNLSRVYTATNPASFNDSNYNGYTHVGNEARAEGYVRAIIFGATGEIIPSEVGGSDTTHFPDYHYTNIPSETTLRGVLFGGFANDGSRAGFAYANSYYAPSNTSAHIGSRLCFIPAS